MAAALRKLFSKWDTRDDRDFYSCTRMSSSSSSRRSSYSTLSSDARPSLGRSSWLRKQASKVTSRTIMTARPRSKRGCSKPWKPKSPKSHSPIRVGSGLRPWQFAETLRSMDYPKPGSGANWSFAALDEDSTTEDDMRTAVRVRPWRDKRDVVESSYQAQRRLDDTPQHQNSRPKRTGSNTSDDLNHLSARSKKRTSTAHEENENDSDACEDEPGLENGGGVSQRNFTSYSREALPAARTAWGAASTSSSASSPRQSKGLHRDSLAPWSGYSPVPGTERHCDRNRAPRGRNLTEHDESDNSSDEEHWWSGAEGGNALTANTTQATVEEERTDQRAYRNEMNRAGPADDNTRLSASEADQACSHRTLPPLEREERLRGPGSEASTSHSRKDRCLPGIDEQLRELEEAARQIDEQVMQLVQDLIRRCEDEGGPTDETAMSLAHEEVRYLEEIAEQIRAEIICLRVVNNAGPTTEQEELDRKHALQLQQDIELEQEERRRQLEADRILECTVCGESKPPIEFPITSATVRCQHPPGLCHACLQSWMASELDSKGSSGFKCPECPELMDFEDVREAASEEIFATYDKLAMRSALGGLDEFAWCLRSGCGNGQLNVENNHHMICQACGYRQCLQHKIQWHCGETCDEYDYRVSGRKAADEARERQEAEDRSRRDEEKKLQVEAQRKISEEKKTEAMIGTVSKECPSSCGRRIQRNQGCDHMTCKCGYEFCWECLAPQKRIDRVGNTAHERHCKNHSNNVR